MYARAMLIGRTVKEETPYTFEDGSKVLEFSLAVKRPFKNLEGKYETDFFKIKARNVIAERFSNNVGKGDLIAVAARLQTKKVFIDEEKYYYQNEIVAESITYLAQSLTKNQEPHLDDIEEESL